MNKFHKNNVKWRRGICRRTLTVWFPPLIFTEMLPKPFGEITSWILRNTGLTTIGTFGRVQYGPGTGPQAGIWSVFPASNLTLAKLQLTGTGPSRTYIWGKRVSSTDPRRKRRGGISSVCDPRKPSTDKHRAMLTQPFLGQKGNDRYASESCWSSLDFKLDVQLSSWKLPSPPTWGVPSLVPWVAYPVSCILYLPLASFTYFFWCYISSHNLLRNSFWEINILSLKITCPDTSLIHSLAGYKIRV